MDDPSFVGPAVPAAAFAGVTDRPAMPALRGPRSFRRRFLLAGLALAALTVVGWFAFPRGPSDDLGRWQGEWTVSAYGRTIPVTVRVEGDRWSYAAPGQPGRAYRVTFTPTTNPKRIDLAQLGDDDRPVKFTHGGGKGAEVNLHGVYALDGDTAVVVLNPGVKPRPTDLQNPDDAQVLNLTRVKK